MEEDDAELFPNDRMELRLDFIFRLESPQPGNERPRRTPSQLDEIGKVRCMVGLVDGCSAPQEKRRFGRILVGPDAEAG